MLQLVNNEMTKLFKQKAIWIMLIGLIVLCIANGLLMKNFSNDTYSDDWREGVTEELEMNHSLLDDPDFPQAAKVQINNEVKELEYYLENDLPPNELTVWGFVESSSDLMPIVSLVIIIVAAGIIANEFRWGTIKLLLIRPISRTKILLSKYISVLLTTVIALLLVVITSTLFGFVLFDTASLFEKVPVALTDGMVLKAPALIIMKTYGYKLINLVMMATFAFMISAVFRNSSLAVGLGIFLMMSASAIPAIFAEQSWAKYILFANTNLQQYETGAILIEGMTLSFSITILFIYYIIFMGLAWLLFTKRDVAGT